MYALYQVNKSNWQYQRHMRFIYMPPSTRMLYHKASGTMYSNHGYFYVNDSWLIQNIRIMAFTVALTDTILWSYFFFLFMFYDFFIILFPKHDRFIRYLEIKAIFINEIMHLNHYWNRTAIFQNAKSTLRTRPTSLCKYQYYLQMDWWISLKTNWLHFYW